MLSSHSRILADAISIYESSAWTGKNWKSEHYHWILNIQIIPESKFSLNRQFLFFGPNFPKNSYLQSKMEKVNSTIDFYIFELD